jgi:hypothetical protein
MRKNSVIGNNLNTTSSQQKLTIIKNPEKIADRLVDKIKEFWKKHYALLDRKGKFKEDSI